MRLVPTYRREASALHAARPAAALAYCCALGLCCVLFWQNPLVTASVICAVVVAASGARVRRPVLAALRPMLWFASLTIAINALVSQRGTTVLVRGGSVLGHRIDITLEAIVWGLVTALSATCILLVFSLYAAVVDPDELLRLVRRWSYRSALTASLATRLVPVLARDAQRISEAARCRPHPPGRFALTRAALAGALERAVDVAAALEVRGYGLARPARGSARPWSRHDVRFATTSALLTAAALGAKFAGAGAVHADPSLTVPLGAGETLLITAILLAGAAPLAAPTARLGVARG